jgi:integrase
MTEKRTLSDIAPSGAVTGEVLGQPFQQPMLPGVSLELAGKALGLAATAAQASRYASASKAAKTRRAYELDWRDFTAWCGIRGLTALPATDDTVCLYLADSASRLAVATLARRLVSIGAAHKAAGQPNPVPADSVRAVWAGIQRSQGIAPHRKTPLVLEALRAVLATLGDDLRGRRDRALLLVGFAGALRRSELVGIDVEDLAYREEGVAVTLRRSKTDQLGAGRLVGIPNGLAVATSPTLALSDWLAASGIQTGAVFRGVSSHGNVRASRLTDRQVARLVKLVADRAGLVGDYSGHSLRAGLATSAAAAGASERAIMAQTGHRSVLIARGYIRPASLFAENAAALVGL